MPDTQGRNYRVTVVGSTTNMSGNCPDKFDLSPGTVFELSITNFHDGPSCQCGKGPIPSPPADWVWSEFDPSPARDCVGNLYWDNFHAEKESCEGLTTLTITAQKVPTGPITEVTNPPIADLNRKFIETSDAGTCNGTSKLSCGDDYSVQIDQM
jgi:hypothetical protein